jgi:hypothetical protein
MKGVRRGEDREREREPKRGEVSVEGFGLWLLRGVLVNADLESGLGVDYDYK